MALKLQTLKSPGQWENLSSCFVGPWIRWRTLTVAERFVCANIIALPVWWVLGLYHQMPFLLLSSVVAYEWWHHQSLKLSRPCLPVIALLTYGTYQICRILLSYYDARQFSISDVVYMSFSPALLLWYIQSNRIKVRFPLVAWACTVSVVQMLGFYFLLQFLLPEDLFWPPQLRTVYSLLTGQAGQDSINKNLYLLPYIQRDILGLSDYRLSLFFIFPEFFAVVAAFFGFVALDIKNKLWSCLLFLGCCFLIFLSATRVVWVAFPVTVGLRYFLRLLSKRWWRPAILALIACFFFLALTFTPTSQLVSKNAIQVIQSINDVRADSTEIRLRIYEQTWDEVQDNLIWGNMSRGDPVTVKGNPVGSHSVILGNLLYLHGLVGTGIFIVFWITLFAWFYQGWTKRPLMGPCVLILYTLVSPTLALVYEMSISSLIILLSAITYQETRRYWN